MKITVNELSKTFKQGVWALKNLDLEIGDGMFGLLGPNGAGKTTLMRILVTLMKPTSGNAKVNDMDIQKHRRLIRSQLGYLPQDFSFFSKLKTWEFLDYVAGLAGLRDKQNRMNSVDEMLHKVGLYDVRNRQANKLSGGMKRRLGIAQALIGDPKIIVVDEPTTGLDPEERIRFRNLLSEMSQKEMIIILSTHIVGDISSSCKNMALLYNGELAFLGEPEKLVEMADGHVWQIITDDSELQTIKEKFPVVSIIPTEQGWNVQLVAEKLDGYSGNKITPTLEHAYVFFTEFVVPKKYS